MEKKKEEIEKWLDNIITTKKVLRELQYLNPEDVSSSFFHCEYANDKEIHLFGGRYGKDFLELVKILDLNARVCPFDLANDQGYISKLEADYKGVTLFALVQDERMC